MSFPAYFRIPDLWTVCHEWQSPLLLFLKLALMGECTGITFIDSTRIPVCENKREYSNRVFKGYAHKGKKYDGMVLWF